MTMRALLLLWLGLILGGCAKRELTEVVVEAESTSRLTAWRADLGRRFAADRLQTFDAALQELRLDAMHRDVQPASAREQDMQAAVHGKSVRAVEILGWQARRARLEREIALMRGLLERDLQRQRQTAATGTPESVLTHIQNARDILARLEGQLADTDRQLATWRG